MIIGKEGRKVTRRPSNPLAHLTLTGLSKRLPIERARLSLVLFVVKKMPPVYKKWRADE